jgi:hypothetical protein
MRNFITATRWCGHSAPSRSVLSRASRLQPRTKTLTTFSFDHSPTACYRGCAIMTGKFMYEPVTHRSAATLPGISRHTKLLETRLTQTKQTTEPATSRHKTATPPHAIIPDPCSAGPTFVRHCGVPQHAPQPPMPGEDDSEDRNAWRPPARHFLPPNGSLKAPFLIDSPKRLKMAVTQTKQTPEAISNRMKIRGVYQIQSHGKSHGDSCGDSDVAQVPQALRHKGFRPEAFEFYRHSIAPAQGANLP